MEEMTVKQGEFPATLDPYVQQGRMFLFNAAQNLIQYGRVLTEAKPLVPRGQFENWVRLNFNMSERSAQGYMQVWKRFGSNAQLADVQFSNLQKMLALPEGTENQFAEQNDLKNMTAREVEKAVRQVRQEEQDKLNLALADAKQEMTQALNRKEGERLKLEARLKEAEAKTAEPDRALVAAIAEKDAHIRTLQRQADKANQDLNDAIRKRSKEILGKKGCDEDKKAVTKLSAAIRKAVLSRYGIASMSEIPKHEYSVAMQQIDTWNDVITVMSVAREAKGRSQQAQKPVCDHADHDCSGLLEEDA